MENLAAVEDEARLVTAARSGRDDAFTELVKLHQPHQLRLAMSLVCNREDAEDVVQEAFLAAWRSIPGLRGTAGFRPWLSRITRNFGLMALRQRKSQRLTNDVPESLDAYPDSSGIASGIANPERSTISQDLASRVRRVVLKLPRSSRDPLFLWTFEEMNLAEIARELNLTLPTVKIRLFRARREVTRRLRAVGTR